MKDKGDVSTENGSPPTCRHCGKPSSEHWDGYLMAHDVALPTPGLHCPWDEATPSRGTYEPGPTYDQLREENAKLRALNVVSTETVTQLPELLAESPKRPEGYYWVRWHDDLSIARWMNIGTYSELWTWVDENGYDYCSLEPEQEVQVVFGPLHLHCYNRSCLRGSGACGRVTAESAPETFRPEGCECECAACCAARGAVNWTEQTDADAQTLFKHKPF